MVKYEIPKPKEVVEKVVIPPVKKEEPEKIKTEEETQIDYTQKAEKEFFDDDDEILEVNFD